MLTFPLWYLQIKFQLNPTDYETAKDNVQTEIGDYIHAMKHNVQRKKNGTTPVKPKTRYTISTLVTFLMTKGLGDDYLKKHQGKNHQREKNNVPF